MRFDIIYMFQYRDYQILFIICNNLFYLVEEKLLCIFFSQVLIDFLLKDIIYNYRCFEKLIIAKILENVNNIIKLA